MRLDNFQWQYPQPIPGAIQTELDVYSEPFRSILFKRGLVTEKDALDFLLPTRPAWTDQVQLRHIPKACSIIEEAIKAQHPIGVFGDYDADGITATALLTLALRQIHSPIIPLIPSRMDDGYGLNAQALEEFARQDVRLVITVDNGIRAFEAAARASELGIQLIITDHHRPGDTLPHASAVIDPKLPDDPYPNPFLSGVGVAYKLVCGLAEIFPQIQPDSYLDLVAIGTIADIVPLQGENRYLVRQGLNLLNSRPRQSLHSLLAISGLSARKVTAADISFQIAPRLNSSGRLEGSEYRVPLMLLLSKDQKECGKYAQILEKHNHERRSLSKDLQGHVEGLFADLDPLPPILIALDEEVNPGVAGIAAGYLSRKYYLPAIVGRSGPETTTASCRSIPEFDIIAALEDLSDLFEQFGGHKLAAGFTLANENLEAFRDRITSQAASLLEETELHPVLEIDAVVDLGDLNAELFKEIAKLEPTGEMNPAPVFAAKGLSVIKSSTVGSKNSHLKLTVSDGSNAINAIGFGFGELRKDLPGRLDAAFHFTENQFRGKKEFQLQIIDLSAS